MAEKSKFVLNALSHLTLTGVELTNNPVDVGLFGTIVEAEWFGTPCAAKMLPEGDAKDSYLSDKFLCELTLWNELKHPNILQFLGVYFPKTMSYPVIVTELQQHNLAKLLKKTKQEYFPIQTKASILLDIALAVRYLHSLDPPILLRGLNANSIYLTQSMKAKLGDFGAAVRATDKSHTSRRTPKNTNPIVCPDYSWPEPYTSTASDVFSFGDLILHVLLNEPPTPQAKVVNNGKDHSKVVAEYQRRQHHITSLWSEAQLFKPLIVSCLQNSPENRPTFQSLAESIETIKSCLAEKLNYECDFLSLLDLQVKLQEKREVLHSNKVNLSKFKMNLTQFLHSNKYAFPEGQRSGSPQLRNTPRRGNVDSSESLKDRGYESMERAPSVPPRCKSNEYYEKVNTPTVAIVTKGCDKSGVVRGDKVTVLSKGRECWQVQTSQTGQVEHLHPQYLEVVKPIEDEVWFSRMCREDMDAHLRKQYIPNSCFAVRKGGIDGHVLAVKSGGKVHYYQIFKKGEHNYSLNEAGDSSYVTISELIHTHLRRKLGLPCLLTFPYISARKEIPRETFTMDQELHKGEVYDIWQGRFAKDKGVEISVAVKSVLMEEQESKDVLKSFYNNAVVLSYIQRLGSHSNIINLYGICWWSKQALLVEELCAEGNLSEYLHNKGSSLTNEHCTSICHQVASALAFLEEHKIVHREVAADSVLVTHTGECKLASFHKATTLAKARDEIQKRLLSVVTKFSRWMAPEVFLSSDLPYTIKSDVWSFGMLMVQVFSLGQVPYYGVADSDVTVYIQDGKLPQFPPCCTHDIGRVIRDCLEFTPQNRPPFYQLEKELKSLTCI